MSFLKKIKNNNFSHIKDMILALNHFAEDGASLENLPEDLRIQLFKAAGRLTHPTPELRKQRRQKKVQEKLTGRKS